MTRIVEDSVEGTIRRTGSGGSVGYLAPELVGNENTLATINSDTYSFAMLILECVTEKKPFSDLPRDAVAEGQRPPRPDGPDPNSRVPDCLWDLMLRCWSTESNHRPTMEEVHSLLHQTQ